MPFPIMAVLGLVASKIAADQAAKQAAAQSAADAANKPKPDPINMQPVTLESLDLKDDPSLGGDDDPFAGENYADGGDPASAHGRTLKDAYSPTKDAPPPSLDPNSPEGVPPSLDPNRPQVPQEQLGGEGKLTGMEMAQLGLLLGSTLGKRQPGPPIPGLPGGGGAPAMKPVFRG